MSSLRSLSHWNWIQSKFNFISTCWICAKNKSKNEENHSRERSVIPYCIYVCMYICLYEIYMKIAMKLNPLNLLCNPRAKFYEESEEGRQTLIHVLIFIVSIHSFAFGYTNTYLIIKRQWLLMYYVCSNMILNWILILIVGISRDLLNSSNCGLSNSLVVSFC